MDDREREMWERLMTAPMPVVGGMLIGAALLPLVLLVVWLVM